MKLTYAVLAFSAVSRFFCRLTLCYDKTHPQQWRSFQFQAAVLQYSHNRAAAVAHCQKQVRQ
ncbi:MAG: hypothetical protein AAGJ35_05245 [Myxococcota bacterium]